MSRALRYILSAAVATVVTFTMLVVGLAMSGAFEEEERPTHEFTDVELISSVERFDVSELLAEREKEKAQQPPPPPPQLLPERTVEGFVQVEYTVDAEGRPTDVQVVGAAPSGYYEEQARERVASRRYQPRTVDGEPVPSRRTEIVEFEVPADSGGSAAEAEGEAVDGGG